MRERMSRREARKMFEQAAQTGYVQHENYEMTLRAQVEERLREREREDSELAEMVRSFKTTIDNMREFLIRNSADDTPRPVPDAYKVTLRGGDSATGGVRKKLEAVSYKRKVVLKKIRKSLRNLVLEEFAQEMRSLPKTSTKSTNTGLIAGKGGASSSIR
ncbi:uncharacterized protein J4E87_000609 [Alternaria ethzedia]|uniref:uncharacterized protein n=1 Tax=Alternaria ethzedia TaxID=181014 RepID=UPI0020C3E702|nr:uncharacterized protein J4E87_000609 [Alternaria ethzedia]KAI4635655.1 hypothetical protein J4E87_000609 [Alternaria ethzedia]